MNKQEMFDTVALGILTQGGPSITIQLGRAQCRYRDSSNRRCAGGFFIPDDKYDTTLEGRDVITALKSISNFNDEELQFIDNLQGIHDEAAVFKQPEAEIIKDEEFFKNWIPQMAKFAKYNNLVMPDKLRQSA